MIKDNDKWCVLTSSSLVFKVSMEFLPFKIDGLGSLIIDPQVTSFARCPKKIYKKYDTLSVTCDTWHVTFDTWQEGGGKPFLKFMLPSSYSLRVKVFWRYFHKWWLSHLLNQLIRDEGVCRTAPGTPGLLKRYLISPWKQLSAYYPFVGTTSRKGATSFEASSW